MLSRLSARGCAFFLLAVTLPVSVLPQASAPKANTKKAAAKPAKSKHPEMPPVQASMVGYIDDAIVGSQARIRFDAAFGDTQPDLAEFFEAQSGYDGGTAAGPKPGLATKLNFQQLYMRGEYAPKKFLSFILELPLRAVQPVAFAPGTAPNGGYGDQSGPSDISAGFKLAALASDSHYVTFQLVSTFPTGDPTKGLGTDHYTVAPAFLYYQKLTDNLSLETEISDSHPISGDTPGFAGDVMRYGIGPSYIVYNSDRIKVAPVLELVGWRIFGGHWTNSALIPSGQTSPIPSSEFDTADGTNIINLKAGLRISIGNNTSVYAGYGHVLTSGNIWYSQILRFEYRRTF
jgi:hypothetical protein